MPIFYKPPGCVSSILTPTPTGSCSGWLAGVWVISPSRPPRPLPSGPSAHELCVALGTCYYDIHPDPHGLWGWSHHVVESVVGFHAESQRWVGALEGHRENGRHFRLKTASGTCCVFFFRDIRLDKIFNCIYSLYQSKCSWYVSTKLIIIIFMCHRHRIWYQGVLITAKINACRSFIVKFVFVHVKKNIIN